MSHLTRRDFLKLSAAFSTGLVFSGFDPVLSPLPGQQTGKPNIIILLFDAMSARNLSLYGYDRETTPNLSRFAERATVYHSHYASGSYTTPGTASIFTGLYPWRHRAINMRGPVRRDLVGEDIFALLGPEYHRTAFTQNMLVEVLLKQLRHAVDNHLPLTSFGLTNWPTLFSDSLPSDPLMAAYTFDSSLYSADVPKAIILNYFSLLFHSDLRKYQRPTDEYPYGFPYDSYNYFENQTVFDGVAQSILRDARQEAPFFGYYHLYSPHAPYTPRNEFTGIFPEIDVPRKPNHKLANNRLNFKTLMEYRTQYDEFIANVDAEFGRLYGALENSGVLDNSYLFVTSDHGELFERGVHGHLDPLLYETGIRVPLLISSPGQQTRQDVYSPTSNVDILPTVINIAGGSPPGELDGKLLPGLGGVEVNDRSIFVVEAKENSAFLPLTKATVALVKGDYKLIYYLGYSRVPDSFELYNLREDVEEMSDLFDRDSATAARMREEVQDALSSANRLVRQE